MFLDSRALLFGFLVAAACAPPERSCGGAGVLCTVAGTGQAGYSGDGGAAADAELYYPVGLAFDPSGRLHMNDWNNQRIRRIEFDGTLKTVIGTGLEGTAQDGSAASKTPLHHALSMAFDAEGRLFLAGNHAPYILRVDLDDRVEIVAGTEQAGFSGDGGPAIAARLDSPCGIAVGADGTMYIADSGNHRIRRVDPAGTITTIAGTGSPGYSGDGGPAVETELNNPIRLRLDPAGGLLVSDTYNHRVRRIDPSGIIETVAGDGGAGAGPDGVPAVESSLLLPYDLLPQSDGGLLIADTGNHRIRRVLPDGTIETVAGTGVEGYDGEGRLARETKLNQPQGLAEGPDGALWIADTFNHRVRVQRVPEHANQDADAR